MRTAARRVVKLEAIVRPHECRRCRDERLGVRFQEQTPGDYETGPNGEKPPMPLVCPDCGRKMPKHWYVLSRAWWDGMFREGP